MRYHKHRKPHSDEDFFLGNMLSQPTPAFSKQIRQEETPEMSTEQRKIDQPGKEAFLFPPEKQEDPWEEFVKKEKSPKDKPDRQEENQELWEKDPWNTETKTETKKKPFSLPTALPLTKIKEQLAEQRNNAAAKLATLKEQGRKLSDQAKDNVGKLANKIKEEKEEAIRQFHLAQEQKKQAKAEEEAKAKAQEEAKARAEASQNDKLPQQSHLLTQRELPKKKASGKKKSKRPTALPKENETLDLSQEELSSYLARTEKEAGKKKQKKEAKAETKKVSSKKKPQARRDIAKAPLTGAEAVKASLDGMYGVYRNPAKRRRKALTALDYVRYAVLFVCIFGFFSAGYFVFQKLYDYYRAHVVYSGLQEMVSQKDYFAGEYLKKASLSIDTLTPEEVLAGKIPEGENAGVTFTEEQETLVGKIGQLKKINPDTVGWISIDGTVVDYPLLWSPSRNYYLHRDFYGKTLSGGAIFIDERNDADITKNRNTVIYGHNMSDGSMFASIHDYASASVFYGTKIEIATQDGIYIYTPFSVHHSNAFDNYFETDFVSDDDFLDFCEQMAFLSIFETDHKFNKNSQIITLSTCMDNESATEERFAVHAILTQVIR